jgi:phage terminase small subunit
MPGTGRKPYETIDVVAPFGGGRLQPPDRLSDDARRHFADLIGSVASGHFKTADLPLVARWAETCAMAERAALQLEQHMVTSDGKLSPWFTIHQACTKTLSGLALRLRLGPQSRMRIQSKKTVQSMSYYDEMRTRKDWDKFP